VADVSDEPGKEWVGTPLDAVRIDPRAIVEITVEFDEGEEVLTPKIHDELRPSRLHRSSHSPGPLPTSV
jgi:hypothetical protein